MLNTGATNAAAKAVQSNSQQPGVFRRLLELLMMLVSAIMVLFAWDTAQKAKQEQRKAGGQFHLSTKENEGGEGG